MSKPFENWEKPGVLHSWHSALRLAEKLMEAAHENMCHVLSTNPYPLEEVDPATMRLWNTLNSRFRGEWPEEKE